MEFERMVTKVQVRRERERRDPLVWGSFCSVTSGNDDGERDSDLSSNRSEVKRSKALRDDEINSIIKSIDRQEITKQITKVQAPFFGPARTLDVNSLRREREKPSSPLEKSDDESETKTFHIDEEINASQQMLDDGAEKPTEIDCDDASDCLSESEKESLESDMIKLCEEIDNVNGGREMSSRDNSSVDLSFREEKALQKLVDKTQEKFYCETYNNFINDEFEFLYDNCKTGEQDECVEADAEITLPVVELREKAKSNKKTPSNNNNVWNPKTENQIRKSGRQQERGKSKSNEKNKKQSAIPCDVIIQKARHVERLKQLKKDENSQISASQPEKSSIKAAEGGLSNADILSALGRNSEFQRKICSYLDYLREIIGDPPEIEDMDDLRKRQKRATEFSNRFARNHLYQIGRLAEEIRLMPDNPEDVVTKTNLLLQAMMHAVQTYLKNVEMFIYNNYPDKLLVLIDFIISALKICFDRMVLDKRDLVVQQMLSKCLDIKQFLEMNQQSLAKFASIEDKRKMSLHSRSSFAYENTYGGSKLLSMYDVPKPKKNNSKHRFGESSQNPYDAKPRNPYDTKPRNPYDSQFKPKILKSSASAVNSLKSNSIVNRSKSVRQTPRVRTPVVKRSRSNVNTMMEQVRSNDSMVVKPSKTESRNQLENEKEEAVNPKEFELMEMIKNITAEKIQEMLGAMFKKSLMGEISEDLNQTKILSFPEESQEISESLKPKSPPSASPRVTSETTPKTKPTTETAQPLKAPEKVSVAKNIQYLYVQSGDEKCMGDSPTVSKTQLAVNKPPTKSVSQQSKSVNKTSRVKVVAANEKPPAPPSKHHAKFMKEAKEKCLKERLAYVEQMMENPLYMNDMESEPWKMFARISDQLLDDMLTSVVSELDFGEKTFVDNFVSRELELQN